MEDRLAKWWKEAKTGNANAISNLYLYYKVRLLPLAKGLLKDDELAEDAFSEAFCRVIPQIPNIRISFAVYLRRATLNICFERLRKRKLERQYLQEEVSKTMGVTVYEDRQELEEAIVDHINQLLSDIEQQVFWRTFEEKVVKVAEDLRISPVHARQLLFTARKKLRKDSFIQKYRYDS